MKQTRIGTFDAAHRVMNERFKCFNIHGHTYKVELEFDILHMDNIGYAIDFKELKRIGFGWLDEFMDHGVILNPKDHDFIELSNKLNSKTWIMSLNGGEYCNPTAENIAQEIFLAMQILFLTDNVYISKVTLYETPNCFVVCEGVKETFRNNFYLAREFQIKTWRNDQGVLQYDDRKI